MIEITKLYSKFMQIDGKQFLINLFELVKGTICEIKAVVLFIKFLTQS